MKKITSLVGVWLSILIGCECDHEPERTTARAEKSFCVQTKIKSIQITGDYVRPRGTCVEIYRLGNWPGDDLVGVVCDQIIAVTEGPCL